MKLQKPEILDNKATILDLIKETCGEDEANRVALAWNEGLPASIPEGLDEDGVALFKIVDPGYRAQKTRVENRPKWRSVFGTRPWS